MFTLKGKFGEATIYSNSHDQTSVSQIYEMLNQEFTKDLSIKIMPDYHAGAGCVIGTTMKIKDKIVPNLVGVDIGCGMMTTRLFEKEIDFEKLDAFIKENIPSGQNVNAEMAEFKAIDDLICKNSINKERALKSIGSLGGGNHFIEIDKSEDGTYYLIVHSGSRYLGKQIAEHYQNLAIKSLENDNEVKEVIAKLKSEGRQSEIEETIKLIKSKTKSINKELAYLEGDLLTDYLHDMNIAQQYAIANRNAITTKIMLFIGGGGSFFHTIHNYIDTDEMILRKGAISAQKGEVALIPINMRDGCIIGVGKGNLEYNYSAPHGAGRLMSRSQAKDKVTIDEFKETMKNVYTTSVNESTIDESPMAYKSISEILDNIEDTIDVLEIIKPVYNFKASS